LIPPIIGQPWPTQISSFLPGRFAWLFATEVKHLHRELQPLHGAVKPLSAANRAHRDQALIQLRSQCVSIDRRPRQKFSASVGENENRRRLREMSTILAQKLPHLLPRILDSLNPKID
jgi:hypothetical protein